MAEKEPAKDRINRPYGFWHGVNPNLLPDRPEAFPMEFHVYFEVPAGYEKHPHINKKTPRFSIKMNCPKCDASDWHVSLRRDTRWKWYLWTVCKLCGFRRACKPLDEPMQ
ncbi:MAG: hypothetical protein ABIH03_02340 [Pseudomonadota bacterium]